MDSVRIIPQMTCCDFPIQYNDSSTKNELTFTPSSLPTPTKKEYGDHYRGQMARQVFNQGTPGQVNRKQIF